MNIYVYCPPLYVSGGPTWLQQIVYELNKYDNITAYCYYNTTLSNPQAKVYTQKYNNPICLAKESFADNDIIIFPEIYTTEWIKDKYKNCIKFILWESVNYYLSTTPEELLNNFPNNTYHIVQGNYAKQYLKFAQVPTEKQISMTDAIEEEFLNIKHLSLSSSERSDTILYNPKKGYEFTHKIMQYLSNDFSFLPLENFSTSSLVDIMTHSKLYIDFGFHPGKDRLPREASACGCCLITSTLGSAKYYLDMPIPEKYKFDTKEENLLKIKNTIEDILNNYEARVKDFQKHRDMVYAEAYWFKKGIEMLVQFIERRTREG